MYAWLFHANKSTENNQSRLVKNNNGAPFDAPLRYK
jgi:hypothetical protein